MKLFYWNCRGFGNAPTQRVLFYYCQHFSPDYICLSEPMVLFSSIQQSYWDSLGFDLLATNLCPLPSLWVFGKRGAPSPTHVHLHDQHITLDVHFANVSQRVSFVYGSVWSNRRILLWSDLYNISLNFSSSWCVLGDFNAVLGAHEKLGRAPASTPCRNFCSFIDDCMLSHVSSRGSFYTWSNGRHGISRVECRLDRVLGNISFFNQWHEISCSVLPRHNSDHSPLLLHCAFSDNIVSRFQFFVM